MRGFNAVRAEPVGHHVAERRRVVTEHRTVHVVAGGGGGDLHLAGLLGNVLALSEHRTLVALDFRERNPGELRHLSRRRAAADPRLDIARRHGNGCGGRDGGGLGRRPAGCHPQCFIDWQLEHLAAGAAQQEMLPVVVDAYKP